MSKYSIVLIDNDNGIKYHLGDYSQEFESDLHDFSVSFKFNADQFKLIKNSLTHYVQSEVPKKTKNRKRKK